MKLEFANLYKCDIVSYWSLLEAQWRHWWLVKWLTFKPHSLELWFSYNNRTIKSPENKKIKKTCRISTVKQMLGLLSDKSLLLQQLHTESRVCYCRKWKWSPTITCVALFFTVNENWDMQQGISDTILRKWKLCKSSNSSNTTLWKHSITSERPELIMNKMYVNYLK